ncbi:MAG: hypothetical protein GWP14_07670, partial [Actinobacteria bacterium]|nr:hypothetical protein [Actinomycetota bacterium]
AGDYRNPPPKGSGVTRLRRSRILLQNPPVHLGPTQREFAGKTLIEMFVTDGVEPLALSVDAIHYHILAKFPDKKVRPWVGRAKLHAYHLLRRRWQIKKLWARLCHVTPISDQDHRTRVFQYRCDHNKQGGWVWTFREGLYWSV